MDHEAVLPDRVREPGSVLVIRLPIQNEVRSLQNYRRYVLESIAQGILVLGEEPPVPEEPEPSSPQCTGRNAAEKRRIFERLQLFRGANGLGCLRRISDKCTFGITDDLLRDILTGNASPTIKEWREIGRALDELEGKGAASE